MKKNVIVFLIILLFSLKLNAQYNPDQLYMLSGFDTLRSQIESSSGVIINASTNSYILEENATQGYIIFKPHTFESSFDQGLPSWNGYAPANTNSGFKVEMRFHVYGNWSNWVTVGYWEKNIWSSYGSTSFNGGNVNIDWVELNTLITTFQFKVTLKRPAISYQSPRIKQLSFFVSDKRTTTYVDIDAIVNDNPPAIFVPTNFVYQYAVDDEIGPDICSPSTVSMIIQSYDKNVDTYQFALKTKDPYWGLFGVWPRVVQHASQYGLKGYVSRYRTWSEAYEVLNKGGRIAMSVGKPLYTGHLIMLAGFDSNGIPIVHDPARSNGYSYKYGKKSISESWFNKGGVSYTFFPEEEPSNVMDIEKENFNVTIFPNPVINNTQVSFSLTKSDYLTISLYTLNGMHVKNIVNNQFFDAGNQNKSFHVDSPAGIYVLQIRTSDKTISKKLLKLD